MLVILLPSPLLGPAVWAPVAQALTARGWPAAVGDPRAAPVSDPDAVLVPHSNAGLWVPSLVTPAVRALYFVDAGLPPRSGTVPLAPPEFLAFLRSKVDADGLLPPWTRWWDDADVLFPDAETRAAVEREQPRLPLSYFTGTVPAPPGWDDRPAGYLAFGDTYAEDRAEAARRGWEVSTLDGQHLHMLIDPAGVADRIAQFLSRL